LTKLSIFEIGSFCPLRVRRRRQSYATRVTDCGLR